MTDEADNLFDGGNGLLAGRARRAIFSDASGESMDDLENVLPPDSLIHSVGLCVDLDSLLSARGTPFALALTLFTCDNWGRVDRSLW